MDHASSLLFERVQGSISRATRWEMRSGMRCSMEAAQAKRIAVWREASSSRERERDSS